MMRNSNHVPSENVVAGNRGSNPILGSTSPVVSSSRAWERQSALVGSFRSTMADQPHVFEHYVVFIKVRNLDRCHGAYNVPFTDGSLPPPLYQEDDSRN